MQMGDTIICKDLLRGLAPFQCVEEAALLSVARQACHRSFLPGEHLYVESSVAEGIWLVKKGVVKLVRLSSCGGQHLYDLAPAGRLMNEEAIFDGGLNPLTAVAVTEVDACILPAHGLKRLFQDDAAFAAAVCQHLSHKNHALIRYIKDLTLRSVKARVAHYLLRQRTGSSLHFYAPRSLIAAHLNMRPETFSRTLRELSDEGLICSSRDHVRVLDTARLGVVAGHAPADLI